MKFERLAQALLATASVIIFAIGVSFGGNPATWLPAVYDIPVSTTAGAQFARSVMGFMIGVVALWITGIVWRGFRVPALVLLAFTMTGLVLGRVSSLIIDGTDVPLIFTLYLIAESLTAASAIVMLIGLGAERRREANA